MGASVNMADQPATGFRLAAHIDEAPAALDAASGSRHAIAVAAALIVQALIVSLFLVKPAEKKPILESSIPIEIVSEAVPKPKTDEKPLPPPPPEIAPPPQSQPIRQSGGDPDRLQGQSIKSSKTRAAAGPDKKLIHTSPAKPPPPIDLSLPSLESGLSIRSAPQSPPLPMAQAAIPSTPPSTPSAEMQSESPLLGEGGGDRYLNAVRDEIVSHLTYPASAGLMHLAGTAQYEIVIDRKGQLLGVRLLQSTGSDILDRVGLQTIWQVAPFGPPPSDLAGERIGMLLTVNMEPLSF